MKTPPLIRNSPTTLSNSTLTALDPSSDHPSLNITWLAHLAPPLCKIPPRHPHNMCSLISRGSRHYLLKPNFCTRCEKLQQELFFVMRWTYHWTGFHCIWLRISLAEETNVARVATAKAPLSMSGLLRFRSRVLVAILLSWDEFGFALHNAGRNVYPKSNPSLSFVFITSKTHLIYIPISMHNLYLFILNKLLPMPCIQWRD